LPSFLPATLATIQQIVALFTERDEIKKGYEKENKGNKEKKEFTVLEREENFGRILTYFVA